MNSTISSPRKNKPGHKLEICQYKNLILQHIEILTDFQLIRCCQFLLLVPWPKKKGSCFCWFETSVFSRRRFSTFLIEHNKKSINCLKTEGLESITTEPIYFCAGSQPLIAVQMLILHGKSTTPFPYFPVTEQILVYKLVAAP